MAKTTLEIGDKLTVVGPRVAKDDYDRLYRVLPGGVLIKRECEECGGLFVMRRSDQLFCSTTCSSRNRQRRYRRAKKCASVTST